MVDHLAQAGRLAGDDVVAEHDRERLVADERARTEDGVPEAERLALAHVVDVGHAGDLLDLLERLLVLLPLEVPLELDGVVEVVLDRALPAPGDDEDVLPTRSPPTTNWMAGLSTIGSISFGCDLVAGRNRVPNPAAGMTAFLTSDMGRAL
jgi:hypothetical protein